MYFSNCGAYNPDGANFCMKCGKALQVREAPEDDLQESRIRLVKTLREYSDIKSNQKGSPQPEEKGMERDSDWKHTGSLFDEFDREHSGDQPDMPCDPPEDKHALVSELERLYQYFRKKDNSYRHLVDSTRQLETQGMPGIAAWIFLGLILSVVIYFLVYLIGLDAPILLPVYWVLIAVFGYRAAKKKALKNQRFYRHMVVSLNSELIEYYNKAGNCCIAYEYSDPKYLEQIIKILKTGRAEKLSEAINIMLNDIHQGKILQQEQIRSKNQGSDAVTNALILAMVLDRHRK